jgi:hypothetical protein
MRSEVRAGRRKSFWVRWLRRKAVCTGRRPDSGLGGQGTSGAHREHGAHVRDLGGVEAAEGLVELNSHLPRESKGGHAMRSGLAGRQQGVWGDGTAPAACAGKARLKAWGAQRARAERT